jgi:hypothetical protein
MLFLLLQSQRPQTCLRVGDFDFAKSAALGYKGRELTPPVPNMREMKPGTTANKRNAFLSDQSDKLHVPTRVECYIRGENPSQW